jgi:diketogulonate reductase-like aldo/keto reductase
MTKLALDSTFKLNDGNLIPRLGLGVYLTMGTDAIAAALKTTGYRHVDTAQWYENEKEVGEAFKESGLKRDQVWITTKVGMCCESVDIQASHTSPAQIWDTNHGYEKTLSTLHESLKKASLDFFDCVLIHSPNPGKQKRLETFRALIDAQKKGLTRSIGVR